MRSIFQKILTGMFFVALLSSNANNLEKQNQENLYIYPNIDILEGTDQVAINCKNKMLSNNLKSGNDFFIPKINCYNVNILQNINFFDINRFFQGRVGSIYKNQINLNELKNKMNLCLSSYDFLKNNIDLNSVESKNLIIYHSILKSLNFLENKKNIENLYLIDNIIVKDKKSYPKSQVTAINDIVDNYKLDENHFSLPKGLIATKKLFVSESSDFDFSTFSHCPNVEEFTLSGSKMGNLNALKRMPLRVLSIDNTLLKNIAGIEKFQLQELSLVNTRVSDFSSLTNLNKIKKLRLSLHANNTFSINFLKDMPLETLIIKISQKKILPPKELFDKSLSKEERQRIHKEYSKKLHNQPKKNISLAGLKGKPIKKLYLSNSAGDIENLEILKTLPLQELYISEKSLTQSDIEVIASIPTLKKLAIVKCNLTNKDLLKILKGGNLTSLNVYGNKKLNNLLIITLTCSRLEYLYIGKTNINHISNITKLNQLKVIEVSNLQLSNLSKKMIDYKMKKKPFVILNDVDNIELLYF
ncbi:hypothetical protein AAEX28_12110 [Lentisphaerota bacterium WC36G]|nr:hypothetical protein LJT99_14940 [Lentisphaerae bacterium WC36]